MSEEAGVAVDQFFVDFFGDSLQAHKSDDDLLAIHGRHEGRDMLWLFGPGGRDPTLKEIEQTRREFLDPKKSYLYDVQKHGDHGYRVLIVEELEAS